MLRARSHCCRVRIPPRLRLVRTDDRGRRTAPVVHGDLVDAVAAPDGRRRPGRGGCPRGHAHRPVPRLRPHRRAGRREPADLLLPRPRRPVGDALGVGQPWRRYWASSVSSWAPPAPPTPSSRQPASGSPPFATTPRGDRGLPGAATAPARHRRPGLGAAAPAHRPGARRPEPAPSPDRPLGYLGARPARPPGRRHPGHPPFPAGRRRRGGAIAVTVVTPTPSRR